MGKFQQTKPTWANCNSFIPIGSSSNYFTQIWVIYMYNSFIDFWLQLEIFAKVPTASIQFE